MPLCSLTFYVENSYGVPYVVNVAILKQTELRYTDKYRIKGLVTVAIATCRAF